MMRLVSGLIAGVALFVASGNLVQAELRGHAVSTSVEKKGKPTVGIYANGGDVISGLLITSTFLEIYVSDCAYEFDWEVTHYGMTEETKDGEFKCEKALGGEANCEYLQAINCVQELIPKNATSIEATAALLGWDVLARTWEGMKGVLSKDETKMVQDCMDTKGKKLVHAAGVKTNKDVVFDFDNTLDMAITFDGVQDKTFWKENLNKKFCEKSGHAKSCCTLPPLEPHLQTTSAKPSADHPAAHIMKTLMEAAAANNNVLISSEE